MTLSEAFPSAHGVRLLFVIFAACGIFGPLWMLLPDGKLRGIAKGLFLLAFSGTVYWFLRRIFPGLQEIRTTGIYGHETDNGVGLAMIGVFLCMIPLVTEPTWIHRVRDAVAGLACFAGMVLLLNGWLREPPPEKPVVIGNTSVIEKTATPFEWCIEKPNASCLPRTCREHRVTIVLVSADWCGPCIRFEEVTLPDPTVQARLHTNNYGGVHVDLDTCRELSKKLGADVVPTVVFLNSDCREIHRFRGGRGPEDFLKELDTADERLKK